MPTSLKMHVDERWWLFKGEAREEVGNQINRQCSKQTYDQISEQVGHKIWNQLGQPAGSQLWLIMEWTRRQLNERHG